MAIIDVALRVDRTTWTDGCYTQAQGTKAAERPDLWWLTDDRFQQVRERQEAGTSKYGV